MIRVLVETSQPVIGIGLCSILKPDEGFEISSICGDSKMLLEAALHVTADTILIDLTSDLGLAHLLAVRQIAPEAKLVLLASAISQEEGFQLMRLGVHAILRSTIAPDVLVRHLASVARGEYVFEHPALAEGADIRTVALSRRDGQYTDLVARGLTNREIASELSLSEGTVRVALSRLYRKVGVKDRYELALRGIRNLIPQQVAAAQPFEREAAGRTGGERIVMIDRTLRPVETQNSQRSSRKWARFAR